MMEAFVAYAIETLSVDDLEATLEAWNIDGLEPVAIELKLKKFELIRRVTAENISRGDYVLASIGCAPVESNFADLAEKVLIDHPKVGLIIPQCVAPEWVSGRVTICRKGIIKHWFQPKGSQESDVLYANMHAQVCRLAGYETMECKTIHYRPLSASLPS